MPKNCVKQINGIQIQNCAYGYRCKVHAGLGVWSVLATFQTLEEAEAYCKNDRRFVGPEAGRNRAEQHEKELKDRTDDFIAYVRDRATEGDPKARMLVRFLETGSPL